MTKASVTAAENQNLATPLDLVNTPTRAVLLADIETRMRQGLGFAVATLNLDHVVKLRRSCAFRAAYASQTHVVADGNPIVFLRRLAGQPVELIPGSELITPLADLAARLDVPLALLGSSAETLALAASRLTAAHPGLRVVCQNAPPFGYDPSGALATADLAQIAASGAGLCFLALGAPKQEILAARARDLAPGVGFVSIGAGLDFIAGSQKRAPLWVRKLAFEWLWRMLGNPRRLFRRYWDCILVLPGMTLAALRGR